MTTARLLAAIGLLAAVPALLPAQQQRPARNCVIVIDSAGRVYQHPLGVGGTVIYAGGGVLGHCREGQTTLNADSMEWFSDAGELHLIGRAHFRDSTEALDADRVTYWTRMERVYSEGHVFARNSRSGSEMRGPNMDYYRAVPPIRDTLDLLANGRPTIRLHPSSDTVAGADTTNPFIIIADRVKLRHTDRFWGSGRVTIDRRDLRGRADSSQLDLADSLAWLIGAARVTGRDTTRPATDTAASYTLTGQRIRFDLNDRQEVRRVGSYRDADARGPDWHLIGDTILLYVDSNRIQRAQSWGTERRPVATSALTTITGDSMDIRMPGQIMQRVWAFRSARAVSRPDSTAPEDDWIVGDSLRATFVRVDSAGAARSDVDHVDSFGSARALYHIDNEQDPKGVRGINYSRGQHINISMQARKVHLVDIVGQVDGVYLEPRPARDTTHADTSAARADSLAARPDSAAARPARPAADSTPPRPAPPLPDTVRTDTVRTDSTTRGRPTRRPGP